MNYIDNSRSFMIKYISHINIILPLNTLLIFYLYISIFINSMYPYIIFYTLCKKFYYIPYPLHNIYIPYLKKILLVHLILLYSHISKKVVAKHAIQFLLDNLDIPT